MTLLDRYFAGKLLATLIKALAGLIMFFILIDFLTHRRTIVIKHDIPWNVVFEYYIVFIPQLIFKYQLAALSVLVAGLLVLGDAAQNNEITAALSGGISLRRLIRFP
ncbi:MAG: YjgP/YjgQ family permease [Candidatus Hydrogenedentes bacterium]|nr:YjgP/YjgQ family permease [Candidatus Hydrogenedentota bacterium]